MSENNLSELEPYQQLAVITMEECAELIQVCSKILRQETYQFQKDDLIKELGDVQCMINLMQEWDVVSWAEIESQVEVKRKKLERWSDLIT
jgi:NTP pyrophosphatase (non-canonical NTP hydrolase)